MRSTRRSVLGQEFDCPFGIAPMGISSLFAYRGDVVLARAAREANVPMIASGASLIPIEEIAAENPGCWCQAYLGGDPKEVDGALRRIERAGVRTLVITVDVPTPSNREQEARAGFSSPLRPSVRLGWDFIVKPRWLLSVMARTLIRNGLPAFENVALDTRIPMFSRTATRDIGRRGRLKWADLIPARNRRSQGVGAWCGLRVSRTAICLCARRQGRNRRPTCNRITASGNRCRPRHAWARVRRCAGSGLPAPGRRPALT